MVQEWHAIFKSPSIDFLAFLQRWLYFGPLERTLEQSFRIEDFSRPSRDTRSPQRALATEKMTERLERFWTSSLLELKDFKFSREVFDVRVTHLYLSRISGLRVQSGEPDKDRSMSRSKFILSEVFEDPRDPLFRLSISVMLDALAHLKSHLSARRQMAKSSSNSKLTTRTYHYLTLNGSKKIHHPSGSAYEFATSGESPIQQWLTGNGWCPSRMHFFFHRLDVSALLFLCQIESPQFPKPHRDCTSYRCNALDTENYKTKHADGCSGCREVVADPQQLLDILRTGSIPLIEAIDENNLAEHIVLKSSAPGLKYTAISHVWSDGLGHQERTALPRCQLLRLSRAVCHAQELRDSQSTQRVETLFWLDTLCCPPDAARQDEAQNLALTRMFETYRDASEVLVLDSWLFSTYIAGMSSFEIILRLLCCNWNSRLWTLQEGGIAKGQLMFQFADKVFQYRKWMLSKIEPSDTEGDNINTFSRSGLLSLDLALMGSISRMEHDFLGYNFKRLELTDRLLHAANALRFRSTSVATDEALCLSNILGISITKREKIAAEVPKQRMWRLWSFFDTVPAFVLDQNFQRMRQPGYHWAPKTLLHVPGTEYQFLIAEKGNLRKHPPRVTKEGLEWEQPGFLFSARDSLLGKRFHLVTEDGTIFLVEKKPKPAKSKVVAGIPADNSQNGSESSDKKGLDVHKKYKSEDMALIFCEKYREESEKR